MQLPEGTKLLNDLQHRYDPAKYDPAKRRAYYLRTRELKGRRRGNAEQISPKKKAAYQKFLKELPMAVEGADLATTDRFVRSLSGKSDAELRSIAKRIKAQYGKRDGARVATIETLIKARKKKEQKVNPKVIARQKKAVARRITNLRKELTELNRLLKEALAEERETKAKEKRGPTAAEKSKAARDADKYRAKNQQKLATKAKRKAEKSSGPKQRDHSSEGIRRRINKTQRDLSVALAKQRSLAKATKNG